MEPQCQDKGLAETATSIPPQVKTDMKEKDMLLKLKEMIKPVDKSKEQEWKTVAGLRG